jgi:L-alanine-DL-glutamate epimerase-like enolase superfamily enzyme
MEPEAGFQRDIEVVKAVRKLAGKTINLVADACSALDLESSERFLDAVGEELVILSDLFPAQIERNLLFKNHLARKGSRSLVAVGGLARELGDFKGLLAHKAADVYRPDIRAFGMTRTCALARRLAVEPNLRLAPRGWSSFLALAMQLVVGRAVPNFLIAEQDPCTSDLFDAAAFRLLEGKIHVPDVPGCGLTLREDVFQDRYAKDAWTVA